MASQYIHNILGNLTEQNHPNQASSTSPLRQFISWWELNPNIKAETWEQVSQALDQEVQHAILELEKLSKSLIDPTPLQAGLEILQAMQAQQGWSQSQRSIPYWEQLISALEAQEILWLDWHQCSNCHRLNPQGWTACQQCGQQLEIIEPVTDIKEAPSEGKLPEDLRHLLIAIKQWQQDGEQDQLQEQLQQMQAHYQAAIRHLRNLNHKSSPKFIEYFHQAVQITQDMATTPLSFEQLDRGYRLLCQTLSQANQLMATVSSSTTSSHSSKESG